MRDRFHAALLSSTCAAAALVVMTAAVAACTSGGKGSDRVPTMTEVSALLARHGAAVMARSGAEFLADVDRDASAASFHGAQSAQIAALADVPLRQWAYTAGEPSNDADATAAAGKRLGAPAFIVHVTLAYRLAVGDPQPSRHDLWWTFVRRGGSVVAAADDDLANAGGNSWRGPWDFGPLAVRRSPTTLVLAHPDSGLDLDAVTATADAAVASVTRTVGSGWARQVAVVVADTPAELKAVGIATSGDASDTVFDPQAAADGSPAGARVVVTPTVWRQLTPLGRGVTLRHEVTHVALAADTTINTAKWVAEGTADYVANLGTGQSAAQIAGELRAQVRAGTVPAVLPSDAEFAANGAVSYEQAWLACRLIASKVGIAGLLHFYRTVGATAEPGDGPVSAGLSAVLHESLAQFTGEWRRYLVAELR